MQVRSILEKGGSLFLGNDTTVGPLFLQDNAQLAGSVVATLVRLLGIESNSSAGLTAVFLLVTVSLPLLAVLGIWFGTAQSQLPVVGRLALTVSSTLLVVYSYLGRIWFSGYLASNIATLCLILIAIYVALDIEVKPLLLVSMVALSGHVYLLFLPIASLIAIPIIISALRRRGNSFRILSVSKLSLPLLSAIGLHVSVLLPVVATGRSFASSQFMVDGGIEPLPKVVLGLSLLIFSAPLVVGCIRRRNMSTLAALFLLVSASVTLAAFSIERNGYVSYYPTKLIIACLACMVAMLASSFRRNPGSTVALVAPFLSLALVASYAGTWGRGEVFVTPYMGTVSTVVAEFPAPSPEAVDGRQVVQLVQLGNDLNRPILLMPSAEFSVLSDRTVDSVMSNSSSELSTRWTNTLAGQWTDQTWSDWQAVQRALFEDLTVEDQVSVRGLVVVTDSEDIAEYAEQLGLAACVIDRLESCR
jgi:hypothetical protein